MDFLATFWSIWSNCLEFQHIQVLDGLFRGSYVRVVCPIFPRVLPLFLSHVAYLPRWPMLFSSVQYRTHKLLMTPLLLSCVPARARHFLLSFVHVVKVDCGTTLKSSLFFFFFTFSSQLIQKPLKKWILFDQLFLKLWLSIILNILCACNKYLLDVSDTNTLPVKYVSI